MTQTPLTGTEEPDPAGSRATPAHKRYWRRIRVRMRIWRMKMRSHPLLHVTWRTVVGVVGGAVLTVGLIMCVTPGPGIAGIVLGLAILSSEFGWANGLLRRARTHAVRAKESALAAERRRRERRRRKKAGRR
ncbi:PGPGW domain-containing protein [Nocardiopsis potens]|uniref:PGPGW domain-containing protein n=1 Tax=Nocardiopsis potens TaxID=1246458 RepID=UPI001F4CDE2D|nr:PGPGW domain-containing protein [Nocardiopsis potens]